MKQPTRQQVPPGRVPARSKTAETLPDLGAVRPEAVDPRRADTAPEVPTAKLDARDTLPMLRVSPEADDVTAGAPPARGTADPATARYEWIAGRAHATSYPTLSAYLEDLPEGLASYPEALAKGQAIRSMVLDRVHGLDVAGGLPGPLAARVRVPGSAGEWVPLVHLCGLHAAIYDDSFSPSGGMAAFEEWSFERNVKLLQTPLFRRLVTLASPELLLAVYRARWSAFYRGVDVEVLAVGRQTASFRLRHPAFAIPAVSRAAIGAAFRAAVVVAGGKSSAVTTSAESSRSARFVLRWT
jgi:hypothetical protein